MRTGNKTIWVLAIIGVVLLSGLMLVRAAEEKEKSLWKDDRPRYGRKKFELTDEKIERIMNRLKETDPNKAEELAKLQKEDEEKFKEELGKTMREQFKKRGKKYGRHGYGKRGPDGHGQMMRDRHGEFLKWLEENDPEEAAKLAGLREGDPELHRQQLMRSFKKYGRIVRAEKKNPKLAAVLKEDLALKEGRDELLEKIKSASDEGKGALVKELEGVIGQRFDLIIKRKQIEYEQLSKRLERLKERVKQQEVELGKYKESKNERMKERVEELMSQTEKFNWE